MKGQYYEAMSSAQRLAWDTERWVIRKWPNRNGGFPAWRVYSPFGHVEMRRFTTFKGAVAHTSQQIRWSAQ
jgi:hypothetical protein